MNEALNDWLIPATILGGGLLLGLLLERILLVWLRGAAVKSNLRAPRAVIDATKGAATEFTVAIAAYIAVGRAPVSASVEDTIRDVLFVLVVFIVTLLIARLSGAALRVYLERTGAIPASSIFTNIIRGVVFIIGTLIVLQHFGVSITPILTAMGVGGLAVALALQDTLSSLFSGLQLLAARQISPGDYIELESGQAGEIVDITWRNTIIRTISNNDIIIPNNKMAASIVTNYQLPADDLTVLVQCGVAYGSDLDLVEGIAIDVACATVAELEGDFADWEPKVRFHTFGDSSIDFTIVLRSTDFREQYALKHEFIKRLKARFDTEGIEIPFPQRVVRMEQGE